MVVDEYLSLTFTSTKVQFLRFLLRLLRLGKLVRAVKLIGLTSSFAPLQLLASWPDQP